MKPFLRIPIRFYLECLSDLRRPHAFAHERIGFFSTRRGIGGAVVVTGYQPALDDEYVQAPGVGACLGTAAVRRIMQVILSDKVGLLHVHLHDHQGKPAESSTDQMNIPPLVEALSRISTFGESGYVILSHDRAIGGAQSKGGKFQRFQKITKVGGPFGFLSLKL